MKAEREEDGAGAQQSPDQEQQARSSNDAVANKTAGGLPATAPPSVKLSLLPPSPPAMTPKAEEGGDEDGLDVSERDQRRSGSSRLASPEEARSTRRKKDAVPVGPTQTAEHLPLAYEEALRTFEEMPNNTYQNNKVGRSRGYEKEAMICECHYRPGLDDLSAACSEDAGCINRLTQVECRASDCNCGEHCQNQRFQKHQYAKVEIVQTEKKGFGLRAAQSVTADRFIYEYIGEVVEQQAFMERMQQYKVEGIRHYYFMMLQREEFLDATKKGGIARFINHSCNPNCYVSKWHVGKHMRMGIFAKRDIVEGEELTFNYNVDRYGNEAQACYCGEPNCVGSIGGKTQTDIGGMDDLFIDALGIADEVDRLDARGTRKKKSRHLDEDFSPTLRPMEQDEVAKVITAVRQVGPNRAILQKLLSRIHMTSDTEVQRALVQVHGFVLMAGVLDEWKDDREVVLLAMGSLARWPLLARNKVVDSGVDQLVQEFATSDDEEISKLAKDLLAAWDALEMSYRIARREGKREGGEHHHLSFDHRRADDTDDVAPAVPLADARAPNAVSTSLEHVVPPPLVRSTGRRDMNGGDHGRPRPSNGHRPRDSSYRDRPSHRSSPHSTPQPSPAPKAALSIEEIIRRAHEADALQRKQAEEAAAAAAAASVAASSASRTSLSQSLSGSKRRPDGKSSNGSADKRRRTGESAARTDSALEVAERRLKKLIGEIVVKCMSSHKEELDHDAFKKHAKELTGIICDKEKRNPKIWPPRGSEASPHGVARYLSDGFSSEKRQKIKSFANDYVTKLLAHRSRKTAQPDASEDTPASTSHTFDTPREPDVPATNGHAKTVERQAAVRFLEDVEDEVDFGDASSVSHAGSPREPSAAIDVSNHGTASH